MDSDGEGSSGSGAEVRRRLAEARDERTPAEAGRSPVTGVVTEALPHALYRVRIETGSGGAGGIVTAHIADRMDRNFVRILVGDRVKVEVSPVDIGRGRIVERL
jgi:translation initiation factor IF-1